MLRAAAAFDAGEGLQRVDTRDVFAGNQSEILVSGELRDIAEALAPEEDGERTQNQVKMLVCGISGRKTSSRSVCAHHIAWAAALVSPSVRPAR